MAIRIDSRGPILYSQMRIGQGGRPFRLYKFRKFHHQAPVAGGALTVANDPRLTRVGWFLERTKLDELPQLWNIVRGEMSVVGPRPETPHFADCFVGRIWGGIGLQARYVRAGSGNGQKRERSLSGWL